MTNLRFLLVVSGLMALVLSSCGRTESTPYEDLLKLIPDTPEMRSYVFMNNYALVREIFDTPLPGPDSNQQAMELYYDFLPPLEWKDSQPDYTALQGPFLSDGYNPWRPSVYIHRQKYLDFDIRNEDQTVEAGSPPGQLQVLRGRFNPEATALALSTCSGECTPPDAQVEHQGVTFYSWGEDFEVNFEQRLAPPVFDHLGRGGHILVQENYVLRALSTEDMKSAIDASVDHGPSLADVEEYRFLARGMSELGAYGVFMTDLTQGFDDVVGLLCDGFGSTTSDQDCVEAQALFKQEDTMLRRYENFATGVGKDDIGQYTAIVIIHADESSAEENVALLSRRITEGNSLLTSEPWADLFDADSLEVSVQGRTLLAKIRTAEVRPPLWINWVFALDPLLLHE